MTAAEHETLLRAAMDGIPQGLAVFDQALRLVSCNRRYRDLLDLPSHLAASGALLPDIALHLARRGEFGAGDPEQLAAARVAVLTGSPVTVTQRGGSGGRT